MEVCQQRAHYTKMKSGIDEDAGVAAPRSDLSRSCLRCVLQCANYSGPDCDYATPFRQCPVDFLSRHQRDVIAFKVQLVGFDVFFSQWLECAETNMESQFDDINPARTNLVEDLRGEVQTSGRRGCRSTIACKHRLVTLAIDVSVFPAYVRGQ